MAKKKVHHVRLDPVSATTVGKFADATNRSVPQAVTEIVAQWKASRIDALESSRTGGATKGDKR